MLSSETRDASARAIVDAFQRCDFVQQAWLLSVIRTSDSLKEIQTVAVAQQNRLVLMILLIRLLEQIDNNLITLSGGEYGGAVLERDATLLACARHQRARALLCVCPRIAPLHPNPRTRYVRLCSVLS